MAHRLEELPLYEKVLEFWDAVTAILQTPRLRNDYKLAKQIADANDSIDANMKEGFEQPTDAAFANFVFTAKGSVAEVIARMKQAWKKNHIADEQLAQVITLGEPLGKMMGGFIKYLAASGFTDRGRHAVAPTPRKPSAARHSPPSNKPRICAPADSGPLNSAPVDSAPVDSAPVDPGPVDSAPVDPGPVDSGPVDSGPRDSR